MALSEYLTMHIPFTFFDSGMIFFLIHQSYDLFLPSQMSMRNEQSHRSSSEGKLPRLPPIAAPTSPSSRFDKSHLRTHRRSENMQGLLTNKLWVILNTSQLFLNDERKSEDGFVSWKLHKTCVWNWFSSQHWCQGIRWLSDYTKDVRHVLDKL